TIWREGKEQQLTIRLAESDIAVSKESAPEAVRVRQAADQALRSARGQSLAKLPGTRREVEAIARLFPDARQLLGADASEQTLARMADTGQLEEFRFVHVATHGVLNREVPMRSALILSQDQSPAVGQPGLTDKEVHDGQLTAERILRTWKLRADLVTL